LLKKDIFDIYLCSTEVPDTYLKLQLFVHCRFVIACFSLGGVVLRDFDTLTSNEFKLTLAFVRCTKTWSCSRTFPWRCNTLVWLTPLFSEG